MPSQLAVSGIRPSGIESEHGLGKTTRLVDWAVREAGRGEQVVFLCAYASEVPGVTDLVATTAAARGMLQRRRRHRNCVELLGGGTITVVLSDDATRLPAGNTKVAVDDWSAHPWSTRMFLHSWAPEWRTEGG